MAGKIVVGATHLSTTTPSGLNRYTGELLPAMLAHEPDLVVYTTDPQLRARFDGAARLIPSPRLAKSNFAGNTSRLLWNQLALPRLLRSDQASVFFSPVPEGMLAPPCPQVVAVHDLVPLLFPESHPRLRYYYRHALPRILAASTAIVAVSEATRRDLERTWGLDRPIHVVYQGYRDGIFRPAPAAEVERVRKQFGLDSFLLAVGDTRPHKNLEGLIRAFARLRRPDLRLAVVGRAKPDPRLRELMESLGVAERVRFLGALPDADLAALYSSALALVFPSHYEGFGIPPLEAMACGCPVVVSRAASLPEVCGDAAVYVDPASVDSIASGISEVVSSASARAGLRQRGLERAERFRYPETARQVLSILDGQREARAVSGAVPL